MRRIRRNETNEAEGRVTKAEEERRRKKEKEERRKEKEAGQEEEEEAMRNWKNEEERRIKRAECYLKQNPTLSSEINIGSR